MAKPLPEIPGMKLFGTGFEIRELALDYLEGALGTVAAELGHAALPLRLILCVVGQVFSTVLVDRCHDHHLAPDWTPILPGQAPEKPHTP